MKHIFLILTLFVSLAAAAQHKTIQIPQNEYPENDDIIQRKNNKWVPRSLSQLRVDLNIADTGYIDLAVASKMDYADTSAMLANLWTAINGKQASLVSGTNIKTVNGSSLLGSGNITISADPTDTTSLSSRINQRVAFTDTAAILENYQTAIATRVRYADTSAMLNAYASEGYVDAAVAGFDTSSLSSRIDTRPMVVTLAQLRAVTSPFTTHTYYVSDAGKQGPFYYDASDASSSDDTAMTVVSGSYRFKRIHEGVIYPEWWGAVGDGTTDDGPAFNAMYRWMERAANRSFEVGHLNRKYAINTQVDLPHSLTSASSMVRVNINGKGVEYVTTSAINVLSRQPADQSDALNTMIGAYSLTIEGLIITGDGDAGQVGMNLSALYTPEIRNCHLIGLDSGIVAKFWLNAIIEGNFFTNNRSVAFKGASGLNYWSGATTSNAAFNIAHIRANRIYNYSGSHAGVMLMATDGVVMDGHISEGGNPRYDIYMDYQGSTVVNGNSFSNIWFESNGGTYATNTCFYIRGQGNILINTIQNDYTDTLMRLYDMSAARITCKNWTYFNGGTTTLFDGGGSLNTSVTIDVQDMPVSLGQYFFDNTKWSDSTFGAIVSGNTYAFSTGVYGLKTANNSISIDPGTGSTNIYGTGINHFGTTTAGLRMYNVGGTTTNYNRLSIYQSGANTFFDLQKGGTGTTPQYQFQIEGSNELVMSGTNSLFYNNILPGTHNTYDIGRASSALQHRYAYIATGIGVGVTAAPSAGVHVLKTTEQLRLGYDASNYVPFTTSSSGDLTVAPTGGDVNITGNLNVTGSISGFDTTSLSARIDAVPGIISDSLEASNLYFDAGDFGGTGSLADPIVADGKQDTSTLLTQLAAISFAENDLMAFVGGVLTNRSPTQVASILGLSSLVGMTPATIVAGQPIDGAQIVDSSITQDKFAQSLDIDNGLAFKVTTAPTAEDSSATIYTDSVAGRYILSEVSDNGIDRKLGSHPMFTRVSFSSYPGGATTRGEAGFTQGTAVGTITGPTPASTNYFTAKRRGLNTSATSAGSYAIFRSNNAAIFQLNTGTRLGGFDVMFDFGLDASLSDGRSWVGVCANSANNSPGNPGAMTNMIGIGRDDTATNFSILHNDGTGTATRIYLGSDFPANDSQGSWYYLYLHALPAQASSVGYKVVRVRVSDGAIFTASGTITTNLPGSGTMMGWTVWTYNGTAVTAAAIAFSQIVGEEQMY